MLIIINGIRITLPPTLQILSINDWNREGEKCIPLRFRCDGRSRCHHGGNDDVGHDTDGEDDNDDIKENWWDPPIVLEYFALRLGWISCALCKAMM